MQKYKVHLRTVIKGICLFEQKQHARWDDWEDETRRGFCGQVECRYIKKSLEKSDDPR